MKATTSTESESTGLNNMFSAETSHKRGYKEGVIHKLQGYLLKMLKLLKWLFMSMSA